MKKSYLVLGLLCVFLACADTTLALTLSSTDTPIPVAAPTPEDGFDYAWTDTSPYVAQQKARTSSGLLPITILNLI